MNSTYKQTLTPLAVKRKENAMHIETQCLHSGYTPKNGEPQVLPIVQSTTFRFDSTEHIAQLFDMPTEFMYSRISNPTCDAVEKKLAALENGIGALLTSSGQAATLLSILNVCSAGDSFISTAAVYGGTVNLFGVTLKKLGIECIWINADSDEQTIQKAFKPNTKAVFCETIANPALAVCDIEKLANIAHTNNVPLIIDNTFATPFLCRPIEWGADIVVHSTTKYLDGHAVQVGGVIIDSGKFDWKAAYETSGKFKDFVEPDSSYHGVVYTKDFGTAAYIIKARMPRYCENALRVAQFFKSSKKIESVRYPGLPGDAYYSQAQKYLPLGASGVISVTVKGGRAAAVRFMDALKLASNVVHVADIRTSVLHPASATHRQLTDEQLKAAGIDGGLVRFSCGLEHIDDILKDIDSALEKV